MTDDTVIMSSSWLFLVQRCAGSMHSIITQRLINGGNVSSCTVATGGTTGAPFEIIHAIFVKYTTCSPLPTLKLETFQTLKPIHVITPTSIMTVLYSTHRKYVNAYCNCQPMLGVSQVIPSLMEGHHSPAPSKTDSVINTDSVLYPESVC